MAQIPIVPTFVTSDTSIPKLAQLSYAVSFLSDYGVRPLWHLEPTATPSITLNTWTTLNYPTVIFDSDGVSDAAGALIVTQGIYAVEACLQITAAGSDGMAGSFRITAGANNPHLAPAATIRFGLRAKQTPSSGGDAALCLSDIVPVVCYPGDKIVVMYYVTATRTSDANTNSSFKNGRFNRSFMGHFISTGT